MDIENWFKKGKEVSKEEEAERTRAAEEHLTIAQGGVGVRTQKEDKYSNETPIVGSLEPIDNKREKNLKEFAKKIERVGLSDAEIEGVLKTLEVDSEYSVASFKLKGVNIGIRLKGEGIFPRIWELDRVTVTGVNNIELDKIYHHYGPLFEALRDLIYDERSEVSSIRKEQEEYENNPIDMKAREVLAEALVRLSKT